jgi:5-formyltetrahydrofolate cyclo-ligase
MHTPETPETPPDGLRRKQQIRAEARARQQSQPHREQLSAEICRKLAALPEYAAAATVMAYVDFGCEVQTRPFLPRVWQQGKRLIVPYCVGEQIELFLLQSLDELAEGAMHILEPRPELRGRADRQVDASQLDLIVVPGLAFDRHGGRLGRGKGYYDRLLQLVPPRTTLVAVCFECQLFPEIPMLSHDVRVHKVITEAAVYETDFRSPLPTNLRSVPGRGLG